MLYTYSIATYNGINFYLTIRGKEIKLTSDKIKGYATFSISRLSEKTPFSYSCLKNEKGTINGFLFTQEQILEIQEEFNKQSLMIKNFLNKNEFRIKCLSYSYFYIEENEIVKSLKSMNEDLFKSLSDTFIKTNRKLFKEVYRIKAPYEDDVIFYIIEAEKEITKEEILRDLTEEESKNYNVNDKIDNFLVGTTSRQINDIDYGKMYKSFKVLKKENKHIIKISKFDC